MHPTVMQSLSDKISVLLSRSSLGLQAGQSQLTFSKFMVLKFGYEYHEIMLGHFMKAFPLGLDKVSSNTLLKPKMIGCHG